MTTPNDQLHAMPADAQRLAAMILAYLKIGDHRTFGDIDVHYWASLIPSDMTLEKARSVINQFRLDRPGEWFEVGHLSGATQQRTRELGLLARAGSPVPPSGLDQRQERAWIRHRCNAVKAGHDPAQADAIASTAMRLPPAPPAITGPAVAEQVKLYRELAAHLGSDRPTTST